MLFGLCSKKSSSSNKTQSSFQTNHICYYYKFMAFVAFDISIILYSVRRICRVSQILYSSTVFFFLLILFLFYTFSVNIICMYLFCIVRKTIALDHTKNTYYITLSPRP